MSASSLLSEKDLPKSFEFHMRGRLELPQATIELHDYHCTQPQHARFESASGFLDLALSHRPGLAQGRYENGPTQAARKLGDIIFIPADHGLQSEWGQGTQSSICCAFGRSANGVPKEWTSHGLEASLDIRSPIIRDALFRLAAEIQSPGFCSDLMAEALWLQAAIGLSRYFRKLPFPPGAATRRLTPSQLQQVEELLELPGPLASVSALAQQCGLSPRHFFRLFRATTGATLTDYAITRRISRAKEMLSAPRPAIKEIAWRCGFETPAAFSAAFRRATGVTPRDYRNQMKS